MSNQIDGMTKEKIIEYYKNSFKGKKGLLLIPSFDNDYNNIVVQLNRLLKYGFKRKEIRKLKKDEGFYLDFSTKTIYIGYFTNFYAISYSIVSSLVLKEVIDNLFGTDDL